MKVTLSVSGGLAPPLMHREYVLDLAGMAEHQRQALSDLIDTALAEPQTAPNRAARDARSYEIRVATDAGEKTLVAYDGAMPPTLRRLIELIKSLAKP